MGRWLLPVLPTSSHPPIRIIGRFFIPARRFTCTDSSKPWQLTQIDMIEYWIAISNMLHVSNSIQRCRWNIPLPFPPVRGFSRRKVILTCNSGMEPLYTCEGLCLGDLQLVSQSLFCTAVKSKREYFCEKRLRHESSCCSTNLCLAKFW